MQKTGGTTHLRPRALRLSLDCLSREIYGKGSDRAALPSSLNFGNVLLLIY